MRHTHESARAMAGPTGGGNEHENLSPMLVDRREAARLLGVSPGTIDNLRHAGELPSVKLGTRRLFDVGDLRRLIDTRKAVLA